MGHLHVASGVGARAAGTGANLFGQQTLEAWHVGVGEEAVDALVGCDVGDEIVHYGVDCGLLLKAYRVGALVWVGGGWVKQAVNARAPAMGNRR